MRCPVDESTLVMSERSGIEIDYCPQCRGVWLDRGELDKIIDRAASEAPRSGGAPAAPAPQYDPYRSPQPGYGQQGHSQPGYGQGHYKKRKKEHWLMELFD